MDNRNVVADPPCKTGSQCTNKCDRCGEVNPAEIHTCTPELDGDNELEKD